MERTEPKIEKELSREEIIIEFKKFLDEYGKEFGVMFTEAEGEYANGWSGACAEVDKLIEKLKDRVPELK